MGKVAKKPAAKPGQPTAAAAAKKARLEAFDRKAFEEAQLTAAAWTAAVRFKVAELVREAARLDALTGHPDRAAGALILRCVLSAAGVGEFIRTVYALEELLDDIFAADCEPLVPDLAGACRRAGEFHAALYAERLRAGAKS